MLLLFPRWGCTDEELAWKYYEMLHRLSHSDVLVETAGFRISPVHPFFGTSPDGCVLQLLWLAVLEIKCPLCAMGLTLNEATSCVANFFLEKE